MKQDGGLSTCGRKVTRADARKELSANVKKCAEPTEYEILGDYLIPHDYDYDVTIPEEETFDLEITYESAGNEYSYEFHSDGTFLYHVESIFGDTLEQSGQYTYEDDIIAITLEDQTKLYWYVLNGIANASVYGKAE